MAGHWTHVASLAIRVLSGLIGFGFLYMAVFMYADERCKQQNRLVDLWVSVKAKEESALSTYSALIKSSSELALLGLRRLFGEKMISSWTVAVSISLSMASVCLLSFVQSSTNSSRLAVAGIRRSLSGLWRLRGACNVSIRPPLLCPRVTGCIVASGHCRPDIQRQDLHIVREDG